MWHRTPKQARFDPWTDSGEADGGGRMPPDGYIPTMLGRRCVHDDARQIWAAGHERGELGAARQVLAVLASRT